MLISRVKIFFLYHFTLIPRIRSLRIKINQLIVEKKEHFSLGKSLLEFPGQNNIIYFIIYKDHQSIKVLEIYDSWIRKLPQKYDILEKVYLNDLL